MFTELEQSFVEEKRIQLVSDFKRIITPLEGAYGLNSYSLNQYDTFKVALSFDRVTGYAIKPDGELTSVFNIGKRGYGIYSVIDAIEHGATKLDAFDGGLPEYYSRFGFIEFDRIHWDDTYAPEAWNYNVNGRPDIIYMQIDKNKFYEYKRSIDGRASIIARSLFRRNF